MSAQASPVKCLLGIVAKILTFPKRCPTPTNSRDHARSQAHKEACFFTWAQICARTLNPVNRIQGKVAYIRPFKQLASLRACNLVQSRKLVGVGHRLGNVSVLAIMSSKIYPKKLE